MENLNPVLKKFLDNQEEQAFLGLFHKLILGNDNHLILYDLQKGNGTPIQVTISPMGISLHTEATEIMIETKAETPYMRYFEETYEAGTTPKKLIFSRYQDQEYQEEELSLALEHPILDSQEILTSSIKLSSRNLLFDVQDLENGHSFFSTLYMQSRRYMEWQNKRIRTILRPFYQTHSQLMQALEDFNPDLKTLSQELLPHRFEDFANVPYLKIYKNS